MGTALFWVVMQRVVSSYRLRGQPARPIFMGKDCGRLLATALVPQRLKGERQLLM